MFELLTLNTYFMSRRLRLLAECFGMISTSVILLTGVIAFGEKDSQPTPIANKSYETTENVFSISYKINSKEKFAESSFENFEIMQTPFYSPLR